jgi:glycosyltransferase involved in cell wall biosynthesis
MRSILLVRNGVDHDARVLRAARVAERTLGGPALIVGVATTSSPAGTAIVEGVHVLRLAARGRGSAMRAPASRVELPAADAAPAPGAGTLTRRARARRILSGLSFAWQALAQARRVRPALVHANDWNTMWCGLAIKLLCGSRLVYDSHELWADRNGRWEWRPWLLASEALFVRAADAVITASPGYADAFAARYRIAPPIVVRNIPEGINGVSHDPQGPPLLVYIGGLMPGRGLEQTIDALALAPAIRLRAVGPGSPAYRASLLERAAAAGVAERVELAPPVAPASVPEALAHATAGLCLIQPICRSYELTLPNKLFEYAAAGVPVLASELPVIAAVVRAENLGEVVPCDDPHGIAAGLERLAEPSRRNHAAHHSRMFARANDWGRESRALAALYNETVCR